MLRKLWALGLLLALAIGGTMGVGALVRPGVFVHSYEHTSVPLIKADPRPYKRRPE